MTFIFINTQCSLSTFCQISFELIILFENLINPLFFVFCWSVIEEIAGYCFIFYLLKSSRPFARIYITQWIILLSKFEIDLNYQGTIFLIFKRRFSGLLNWKKKLSILAVIFTTNYSIIVIFASCLKLFSCTKVKNGNDAVLKV